MGDGVGSILVQRDVPEYPSLTHAAIDAVGRWRYEPATRDRKPVDVFFTVVINFTLRNDESGEDPETI